MDQQDRPRRSVEARQQALDEAAMHVVGLGARPVLQHAQAIDHDIRSRLVDQARQFGGREFGQRRRSRAVAEARRLRQVRASRGRDDTTPAGVQPLRQRRTDQAGGAENENCCFVRHGHPGLAIISQTIAATAPKPGKPKANHSRNSLT